MGKAIIFSGRIKSLVDPAKENGGRDCEAKEACEQPGPNHVEAQAPNQNWGKNKQIHDEPVREYAHVSDSLVKRFPSFGNSFGVELVASHFLQSSFPFGWSDFGQFVQLLGDMAGKSHGADFQ